MWGYRRMERYLIPMGFIRFSIPGNAWLISNRGHSNSIPATLIFLCLTIGCIFLHKSRCVFVQWLEDQEKNLWLTNAAKLAAYRSSKVSSVVSLHNWDRNIIKFTGLDSQLYSWLIQQFDILPIKVYIKVIDFFF